MDDGSSGRLRFYIAQPLTFAASQISCNPALAGADRMQLDQLRRREFITLLGGAAAAWPLVAQAQQGERARRIGVLMNLSENAPTAKGLVATFGERLREMGWEVGRNALIDVRWGAGDAARYRKYAAELVALTPDVILAATTAPVMALKGITPIVPIVFVGVIDPVGSGLVASLARPGGNATGFTLFEYAIAAKWLELLKEISPRTTRVAVLRDPSTASGIGQFAAVQTVAPMDVELSALGLQDAGETEQAIAAFARGSNGGLIVTASGFGANHTDLIAALAARNKLPAVYPFRYFVTRGGLISYGPDSAAEYRLAARYVDRILRGEKPADLPVQSPVKYEMAINLKTAKALGLEVPPTLLARADEVIE
jgi:putative ABC transport system substrate-binding protein